MLSRALLSWFSEICNKFSLGSNVSLCTRNDSTDRLKLVIPITKVNGILALSRVPETDLTVDLVISHPSFVIRALLGVERP